MKKKQGELAVAAEDEAPCLGIILGSKLGRVTNFHPPNLPNRFGISLLLSLVAQFSWRKIVLWGGWNGLTWPTGFWQNGSDPHPGVD